MQVAQRGEKIIADLPKKFAGFCAYCTMQICENILGNIAQRGEKNLGIYATIFAACCAICTIADIQL